MISSSRKNSKKRSAPLSLRLSENERAKLTEWAGGQPLSTYIKAVLFSDIPPKMRNRSRLTAKDRQALTQLLAWLGQTQVAVHLAVLANAAESGSLDMNEPVIKAIFKACSDIDYMRGALMCPLGKQVFGQAMPAMGEEDESSHAQACPHPSLLRTGGEQ